VVRQKGVAISAHSTCYPADTARPADAAGHAKRGGAGRPWWATRRLRVTCRGCAQRLLSCTYRMHTGAGMCLHKQPMSQLHAPRGRCGTRARVEAVQFRSKLFRALHSHCKHSHLADASS
jgi:hypothetical protein